MAYIYFFLQSKQIDIILISCPCQFLHLNQKLLLLGRKLGDQLCEVPLSSSELPVLPVAALLYPLLLGL